MTKADLINLLSQKAGITRLKAEVVVNTVFDSMATELNEGRRVEVRGFGTFQVRAYDAYTGRNPRNGNTITVKAKFSPFFKTGKDLRDAIKTKV